MSNFDFERLNVYHRTIDYINKVFTLCADFSYKIQNSLGDQFRRAALSIANNIAEGSNKKSKKEKVQFYNYALNSARECVPVITVSLQQNLISAKAYNELREDCIIICKMLSKLIKSVP